MGGGGFENHQIPFILDREIGGGGVEKIQNFDYVICERSLANPGQKKCNIWSLRIQTIFIKHT